jgi:membrane protein YqaA with SNARE-associated domain
MAESLRDSALPRALSDVVGDLADLIQKELRLARAELTDKLSLKLRAGIWMSVAAFLGVCVVLLALEAVVFAIASFGIAMHWSCLIVAASVGVIAGGIFAKAKADGSEELMPERTIRQVNRDIATAKEQLT